MKWYAVSVVYQHKGKAYDRKFSGVVHATSAATAARLAMVRAKEEAGEKWGERTDAVFHIRVGVGRSVDDTTRTKGAEE